MNIIKVRPASLLASPRHARLHQNTEPWQHMAMIVPLTDYKVKTAPYLALYPGSLRGGERAWYTVCACVIFPVKAGNLYSCRFITP